MAAIKKGTHVDVMGTAPDGHVRRARFFVHDRLGSGYSAKVFLVSLSAALFGVGSPTEQFAVKLIDMRGRTPQEQAYFVNEAHTCLSLHHPNVVKVYSFLRTDTHLMIFMEHARGGDLRTLLFLNGGGLAYKFLQPIVAQMLQGLCYIWRQGKVVRDIKPDNVLLNKEIVDCDSHLDDLRVTVCDFTFIRDLTRPGILSVCGTDDYKAPEQLLQMKNYNLIGADIYSAGVVISEAADGADGLLSVAEVYGGKPFGPRVRASRHLHDLVSRMMRIDPRQRITPAELPHHRAFTTRLEDFDSSSSTAPRIDDPTHGQEYGGGSGGTRQQSTNGANSSLSHYDDDPETDGSRLTDARSPSSLQLASQQGDVVAARSCNDTVTPPASQVNDRNPLRDVEFVGLTTSLSEISNRNSSQNSTLSAQFPDFASASGILAVLTQSASSAPSGTPLINATGPIYDKASCAPAVDSRPEPRAQMQSAPNRHMKYFPSPVPISAGQLHEQGLSSHTDYSAQQQRLGLQSGNVAQNVPRGYMGYQNPHAALYPTTTASSAVSQQDPRVSQLQAAGDVPGQVSNNGASYHPSAASRFAPPCERAPSGVSHGMLPGWRMTGAVHRNVGDGVVPSMGSHGASYGGDASLQSSFLSNDAGARQHGVTTSQGRSSPPNQSLIQSQIAQAKARVVQQQAQELQQQLFFDHLKVSAARNAARKICTDFQLTGMCPRGDACGFLHNINESVDPAATSAPVCGFFPNTSTAQDRRCMRQRSGAQCTYIHNVHRRFGAPLWASGIYY